MAMKDCKIAIVGCGPGSVEYLTDAARAVVARAEVLVGNGRLLELFPEHSGRRIAVGGEIAALLDTIGELVAAGRSIAVLVSGDPGLYSLASLVLKRFGRTECEVIPGISSVQIAFARLGLDWADARILSAHGRTPQVTPEELSQSDKIAILAGTRDALQWAAQLASRMGTSHVAFLCENLTLPDERIQSLTPEELASVEASRLSMVLLIRKALLP